MFSSNQRSRYENEVFVSYAWDGESERTVDELEQVFAKCDIRIIRDKKDLAYKGSIEAFEQRIGQGRCVILVISDKYLRSEHCMYELVEVDKNQGLRERVFPIVLADAQIYTPKGRLNYIKYWDKQIEQLNQDIKKRVAIVTGVEGIIANLGKYKRIRDNIDHLTDHLKDMNALTPEIHATSGYSKLISAVGCAISAAERARQYYIVQNWDKRMSFIGFDLSSQNLAAFKLDGADLENTNLQNVDLKNASLKNANLQNANLQNANLEKANLQNANLENAKMVSTILEKANLENAKMQKANLENAKMTSAILSNANLENAKMADAILNNINLTGAIIKGADLHKAELKNASLQKADLENVNLQNADLENAKVVGALLNNANLEKANLQNADLENASLQNAILENAEMAGTILNNVNLERANLTGAKNLNDEQLEKAHCLKNVTMPNEHRYNGKYNLRGDLERICSEISVAPGWIEKIKSPVQEFWDKSRVRKIEEWLIKRIVALFTIKKFPESIQVDSRSGKVIKKDQITISDFPLFSKRKAKLVAEWYGVSTQDFLKGQKWKSKRSMSLLRKLMPIISTILVLTLFVGAYVYGRVNNLIGTAGSQNFPDIQEPLRSDSLPIVPDSSLGGSSSNSESATDSTSFSNPMSGAQSTNEGEDVVFKFNAYECPTNIFIFDGNGNEVMSIQIPSSDSHTLALPPGNYEYKITFNCPPDIGGVAGLSDTTQEFLGEFTVVDGTVVDIPIVAP
jgi:uncharacterized protein YjbI with pentapeptide repeats